MSDGSIIVVEIEGGSLTRLFPSGKKQVVANLGGGPNGAAICVATLVRGGISVFSPAGELLEFHEADEVYCTNICFGGPDMRTACVTLSGTGRLMAVNWPRPGLALHGPRTARRR